MYDTFYGSLRKSYGREKLPHTNFLFGDPLTHIFPTSKSPNLTMLWYNRQH